MVNNLEAYLSEGMEEQVKREADEAFLETVDCNRIFTKKIPYEDYDIELVKIAYEYSDPYDDVLDSYTTEDGNMLLVKVKMWNDDITFYYFEKNSDEWVKIHCICQPDEWLKGHCVSLTD